MKISLPPEKGNPVLPTYFPTLMQAVVFRNWGMVSKERIADVLETEVCNIERLAEDMGLLPQENTEKWSERGYITIIRSNWHLLNYRQLLTLLGWSEDRLAMVLKEEDFLEQKLGSTKPVCEEIIYRELTEEEAAATAEIKATADKLFASSANVEKRPPFDFYGKSLSGAGVSLPNIKNNTDDEKADIAAERFAAKARQSGIIELVCKYEIELDYLTGKKEEYHRIIIENKHIKLLSGGFCGMVRAFYRLIDILKTGASEQMDKEWSPVFERRIIYPFSAMYNDVFDGDEDASCPDELLDEYAEVGINGIWLPAVLYRLTEFPYAPELSLGWETRLENLGKIVRRAELYGIKVYLYLNEPRSMPITAFNNNRDMIGTTSGENATMCIHNEKTRKYLENALAALCRAVPKLGGFMMITMGENLTLCQSKPSNFYDEMCPVCKNKETWQSLALLHTTLTDAVKKTAPQMKMMFFDWSWDREDMGMDSLGTEMCIKQLPKDAILLSQRETHRKFSRGGVANRVEDYSISVGGIGPRAKKHWEIAVNSGHDIAGKIQVNNSWECSTVPYLPVFQKFVSVVEDMRNTGITDLVLNWTLGGYPSPAIRLLSELFFKTDTEPDFNKKLTEMYGNDAERVWKAAGCFSRAFEEFPFDKGFIYLGPINSGVGNIFYENPTGRRATMTCYAYDDLDIWSRVYLPEILEEQLGKLCGKWQEGLELINDMSGEFRDVAVASYIQLRSSYNVIRFIRLRDADKDGNNENAENICRIIDVEKKLAEEMYRIMLRRPEIGFESANHYYISLGNIEEKLVNLAYLEKYYRKKINV